MNTDQFTYNVVRTYNLLSKRDIVKRFDTYWAAHTAMISLNAQAESTSYCFHVESKPKKKISK
jgi:hypothetical protein